MAWVNRFSREGDPELAATIRNARRRLRWSQRRLAEEAGISHGYLADIELGNRCPTTQTRFDLAWALRLDPADLGVELPQPELESEPSPPPAPPPPRPQQPSPSQLLWLEANRRHEAEMERWYRTGIRPLRYRVTYRPPPRPPWPLKVRPTPGWFRR